MVTEETEIRPRRAEQRGSLRRSAPLRCWLSDGGLDRYVMLADISTKGARIITVSPPAVASLLTLRLRLGTDGDKVRAVARVVWRAEGFRGRGGVAGVRFTDVVGAEAIARFVVEG